MIQSQTSSKLFDLIKTVRDFTSDFKTFKDGEMVNRKELFTKFKGTFQKYDEGIKSLEWTNEYIIKEDSYWSDFGKYFKRMTAKFPILVECTTTIEKDFHIDSSRSQSFVHTLLHYLLYENETILTDKRIVELITILVNDINKTTPFYKIKLWVDGIWLYEESLVISEEILIRRPNELDFEFSSPATLVIYAFSPSRIDNCSAIIEITKKFENQNQINLYIKNLVATLNIYNLGSIKIKRRECKANSLLNYGTLAPPESNSIFSYGIANKEKELLSQFIDDILNFLPPENWKDSINPLNPIYIGIERYFEVTTNSMTTESRITTSITSLEALLLKGSERSELSHKLSQRVSYLSRYFKDQPIKVYSTMKRAYEIRSNFIHGSMLPRTERNDLNEILKQVLISLRRVILIFIDLSKHREKDVIISKIDNAIIDQSAHKKLSLEIMNSSLLKLTAHNTGMLVEDEISLNN